MSIDMSSTENISAFSSENIFMREVLLEMLKNKD